MNVEEAIKCVERMGEYEHFVDEPISKVSVLSIIRQIKQPKPEIPQFVADWIEYCKKRGLTLKGLFSNSDMPAKIFDWIFCSDENCRLMAEAWINGYTVKKEKLYTVEIPNIYHGSLGYLGTFDNLSFYNKEDSTEGSTEVRFELTEREIKQADERLWQFAEEVTE